MKLPVKVIVAILVVLAVASGALWNQSCTSGPKSVKLSAHDMELLFKELLPPAQQQEIAASPEEKKKLVEKLKQVLALAQAAEQEGYLQRPEIASQVALQSDLTLARAYRKSNPDAKVGDDEINAYHAANPKDFDAFLQGNPRLQQQAQDAQRDMIKKQYGEVKVLAEHARKDKIDQQDLTRLQVLLDRSSALAGAYMNDLQKNSDKLVSDGDIEQYFADHGSEFDEVRLRHILISIEPKPAGDEEGAEAKDKKDAPKPPTKEEAKKKAEALLARARNGEDFAKLAKENSDDPGSKDKGGEYDFFGRGRMVPEFEEVAFKLKPGEISEPVETQFGYHIILLEERRAATSASDPKVRQQITDKLKQEKVEARVDEITAASSVEVAENFDTTPKQPSTEAMPAPAEKQ
ncbi:MAG TPA: peptidylprolyl isomerase [Blastocatellia bacterium]|nr:peptidylprolyl isomerase [Blastocatellia bacterium]